MARRKHVSQAASKADYKHICPICRLYDPAHFAHVAGCPLRKRPLQMMVVSLTASLMRRDGVVIKDAVQKTPKQPTRRWGDRHLWR